MNINKLRIVSPIFFLLFLCFLPTQVSGQLGNAGSGSAGKTSKTKKSTAKKPAKSKTKKPVNNSSEETTEFGLDDLVGTWRTIVAEQGQTYQIDVTFTREGTTEYLITDTAGRTATQYGGWSYSNGILYEKLSSGANGRGSIEWIDINNLIVTIIDNGDPAYKGIKRRYKRIG